MPVKVRCPSCEKVLNAPDAARGKALRCPKCKSKVKVPSGRPKKKAVAQAASPDSTAFLMNLDAGSVEDHHNRICPKCGSDVSDDDVDCPECGVNVETGVMSEKSRRKRTAKSADARKFYQEMRRDSWSFWKSNMSLSFRTTIYLILLSLVSFGCLFMTFWCLNLPPKTFWALCSFVFAMVGPGWMLFLQLDLIRFTMERKKKLKRINFDFFLSAALGVRLLFWTVITVATFQIVTGSVAYMLIQSNQATAGYVLIGLGCLPAVLVFPIAASHMAMPIQIAGWLIHKLLLTLLRTWKGVAFWFVFLIATNIPALACFGILGVVHGAEVREFLESTAHNRRVNVERAKVGRKSKELVPDQRTRLALEAAGKPREVDPMSLLVPAALWVTGCAALGMVSVFNMRSTGLFTLYFRHDLDLVAKSKETTYTSRSDDMFVEEANSTVTLVALLLGFSVAAPIGYGATSGTLVTGLILAALAASFFIPLMGLWRIFEKAGEPGWGVFSPVHISRVLLKPAGYPELYWVLVLLFVPVFNLYVWYKAWVTLAARFQKPHGFGIGLAFFPLLYPVLAFSPARCLKAEVLAADAPPPKKAKAKGKRKKKS